MRLLHTCRLDFQDFFKADLPEYAILSHCWSGQEVSFEDFEARSVSQNRQDIGYRKIMEFCKIAASYDLDWAWIDTCCIDKRCSAEVAEAINSMCSWYECSKFCMVAMPDVRPMFGPNQAAQLEDKEDPDITPPPIYHAESVDFHEREFRESTWFTRAWTLQELLAPTECFFYNNEFEYIGSKSGFRSMIHEITNIHSDVLSGQRSHYMTFAAWLSYRFSISERMSWVRNRQASKEEDIAYCLLGIFDVNMPLLYGEGSVKAFIRLQRQIFESTIDDSIYVWDRSICKDMFPENPWSGLLAPCPAAFSDSKNIHVHTHHDTQSMVRSFTNVGLELQIGLPATYPHVLSPSVGRSGLIILACDTRMEPENQAKDSQEHGPVPIALVIREMHPPMHSFGRLNAFSSPKLIFGRLPILEINEGGPITMPFDDDELDGISFVYSARSGIVYTRRHGMESLAKNPPRKLRGHLDQPCSHVCKDALSGESSTVKKPRLSRQSPVELAATSKVHQFEIYTKATRTAKVYIKQSGR
jgi:hypothetical protein